MVRRARLKSATWKATRLLAALAMFGVVGLQLRSAGADYFFQQNSEEGVRQALRLAPGNVEYWGRLAQLSADGTAAVRRRQLALQPRLAEPRIELATQAEFNGDPATAERLLLESAHYDRTWLPRWVLMNFYFRHGDKDSFWRWASSGMPYAHGDLTPLFELCLQIADDPASLLDRLPVRTIPALRSYAAFLRIHHRLRDSANVARHLIRPGQPSEDLPMLLSLVDQLIDYGDGTGAVTLWNELVEADWTTGSKIDVERPIINSELVWPFSKRNFNWRFGSQGGITLNPGEAGRGLTVSLSGVQPDGAVALEQFVAVEANTEYLLKYHARVPVEPQAHGLLWRVRAVNPKVFVRDVTLPLEAGMEDVERHGKFLVAPGVTVVRLQLMYQRPAGHSRYAGSVELGGVHAERRVVAGGALSGTEDRQARRVRNRQLATLDSRRDPG